jgi:hypothetical protein
MADPLRSATAGHPRLGPANPGSLTNQALWDWLGLGSLASLVACYSVATQSLILGSSGGGWIYGYVTVFGPRVLLTAAAAIALSAGLLLATTARGSRHDWPVVFAWMAIAVGVQALMRSMTPFSFERIFVSDGANAFYGVTEHFRARAVLADFDHLSALWPLHAQSNMPGKMMLLYALRGLSRAPGVLAWLVVLVSNGGAALMYLFVRELFANRRMAIYSSALYLLVPAKLYFFPLLNTVTPVVVLACAVLVFKCLRTGKTAYSAALGVALFGLMFFEPLPLVVGLLFALLVVQAVCLDRITWVRLTILAVVGIASWLAAYGAVRLIFGFDLVSALRKIGQQAVRFNEDAARPYSIWIRANLGEFFFGVGVCQAVLFPAALMDGLRRRESWRDRLTQPIAVVCIGVAVVLLATDVIGVNRGEVIRLWIFLACFFQIPAAYVCDRLDTSAALVVVMAVTILQSTLGTAMIGFIVPG